jgi:quinol monooxygenase YgiN
MIRSSLLKTFRNPCVYTVIALSTFAAALPAQEKNIRSVTFYKISPGRVGDFQAAVKEFNGVLTKAGSNRAYSLWVASTGTLEYALVSHHSKYAELDYVRAQDPQLKDQQADLARIVARINQCTDSSRRVVEEVRPDLSLPDPKEISKVISVLTINVHPGKIDEYVSLVKSELYPAVKKSGMKMYNMSQTRYGGPRSQFTSVAGFDKWADLDDKAPIVKAMGQEAYDKYLAKVRPLMSSAEYEVYRFLPELSYMPVATGAQTGGR